ncbi:MAG TPA: hypothetical protein VMN60_04015 [Longimicrobiales bacterium]|nr:hypothetical protein [Longimicrobiales bacterium]
MIRRTAAGVAFVFFFFAAPVTAQSLFSIRGLGVPVPPVDARATALGGIGVGLIGFHTSLTNPAELAGVSRRGVSAALQPMRATSAVDGVEDNVDASRFPLMSVIYPVSRRIVASAAYGAYLEQSWGVTTASEVAIGERTYGVTDVLRSRGGIAQLRVNVAYQLSPTLALGVGGGLLTGNVERVATRTFDDTTRTLVGFRDEQRWHYTAPVLALGARWDIAGRMRVGASAMAGGALAATGEDGAGDREYGAPLELAVGASAQLSSVFVGSAGTVWSRLPAIDDAAGSRSTVRLGAGLEYQGVRSGQRVYPVRLGARWAQLPYHDAHEDAATEWHAGIGGGFRLGDPADPAAVADFAIERGGRSGLGTAAVAPVDEKIWRFTFSLSLFAR